MKWLAILCLIIVLEVPLKVWNKMPETEKDRLLTTCISEFCSAYAKKHNVHKFKIRLIPLKDRVALDITPEETQI